MRESLVRILLDRFCSGGELLQRLSRNGWFDGFAALGCEFVEALLDLGVVPGILRRISAGGCVRDVSAAACHCRSIGDHL
jgi:hypothetical protein